MHTPLIRSPSPAVCLSSQTDAWMLRAVGNACRYLEFTDKFEKKFVTQGPYENRTIYQSLDEAWKLLRSFPKHMLKKISSKTLEDYYIRGGR